jgi:hypothetical protein
MDPIITRIDPDDPKTFFPELRLRYIPDDKIHVITARKDDDSGWWMTDEDGNDSGGLSDVVYRATPDWTVAAAVPMDEDDEIESVGLDIENLSAEDIDEMVGLMHASNESRVEALEEKAGPNNAGSLENAFDALRMMVFLEQIAAKLDISAVAHLDFEGRRAAMLTKIEATYANMLAARQAADRAQRMGAGPQLRPVPGRPPSH